ncbi:unnamed protein product [Arabis nemorensis]|uniref:Uncharacterized protein n=1 Tax=Arabis nemorensis TaxID=586526 RepID=A0A565CBQ6_9BRAS|nr:unnamed protein product [Arabis nemorensis]
MFPPVELKIYMSNTDWDPAENCLTLLWGLSTREDMQDKDFIRASKEMSGTFHSFLILCSRKGKDWLPPVILGRLNERFQEEVFLAGFPCFCVLIKLCEIASGLASTEDLRGSYLPKLPSMHGLQTVTSTGSSRAKDDFFVSKRKRKKLHFCKISFMDVTNV